LFVSECPIRREHFDFAKQQRQVIFTHHEAPSLCHFNTRYAGAPPLCHFNTLYA
jgi:hypothetical protein